MAKYYKYVMPIYAAIAGDVIGSWLEDKYEKLLTFADYPLFCDKCFPTDDSVFTVAIAESLLEDELAPDDIVRHLQKWGRMYPDAGYGTTTKKWIFSECPQPYGSNRNGGAMRVSACGVVAQTLQEALDLAALTCNVSHNTSEGVAGAQAIAAAIYLARRGLKKEFIKSYIEKKFGYDLNTSIAYQKEHYAGFSCKAADTVPQSIRCFIESEDVESAIRLAISLGSDADTLASMAAAIAAAYYKRMPFISQLMPYVPDCMKEVLDKLEDKLRQQEIDRALHYRALLCTAIDVFQSRYAGMKFANDLAVRKWIIASLPDHYYTPTEWLTMNELLAKKLCGNKPCIPDCKSLKATYSDIEYIRRNLPDVDRMAAWQLAEMSDADLMKKQQEEEQLQKSSPKKTIVKIPHFTFAENSYCNGYCMSGSYIFDYYEDVEAWE